MYIYLYLLEVDISLIDKTQSSDLLKREYYWMRRLTALVAYGLNSEETY